ncbi:hypothetical protein B5V00_13695 [Geothermobacter hydrogeniphilus]|uniref:Uncharacterized protein n=2 Tax=Geothermobacter hydrogeniphilus TaxID=1969733 RepID=A0A1X0XXI7_9BACT|nr:hypothetical protein B5V00_13695 [Geothermobacter hydrogeniphilus]
MVLAATAGPLAQPDQAALDAARQSGGRAGTTVLQKFGGQSGVRQGAIEPLTTTAPLSTVDNSRQVLTQLSFPSSQQFLDVMIQPGPTGDISMLKVMEDLDFDGQMDFSWQAPAPVSGVCANGVIMCDPGSWDNCTHFAWNADTAGRIALQSTAPEKLGGCYCINSYCGNNLIWNNAAIVLKDLGGGVVGAIQRSNPALSISDVQSSPVSISYFGQDTSRRVDPVTGQTGSAVPVPPVQSAFVSSPASLPAAVNAEVSAQATDPGSLYSRIGLVFGQASNPAQTTTCSIDRVIDYPVQQASCLVYAFSGQIRASSMKTVEATPGTRGIQGVTVQGARIPLVLLDGPDGSVVGVGSAPQPDVTTTTSQWGSTIMGSGYWSRLDLGGSPWSSVPNVLAVANTPTGVRISTWNVTGFCNPLGDGGSGYDCGLRHKFLGGVEFRIPGVKAILHDATGTVRDAIIVTGFSGLGGSGGTLLVHGTSGATLGSITFQFPPPVCPFPDGTTCSPFPSPQCWRYDRTENVVDRCQALEHDPDCRLWHEDVDGVTTFQEFNATMLTPQPSCRDTQIPVTPPVTETDCENWWTKTRTYMCVSTPYDFSTAAQRYGTVARSITADGSTYQDRMLVNGTWLGGGGSVSMMDFGGHDECQQACKTRRARQDSQATLAGTSVQYQNNTSSWDILYHSCDDNGCPVGPGEEILKDCQCLNEFAEAATVMQMLRQAGRDMICSDGVPK